MDDHGVGRLEEGVDDPEEDINTKNGPQPHLIQEHQNGQKHRHQRPQAVRSEDDPFARKPVHRSSGKQGNQNIGNKKGHKHESCRMGGVGFGDDQPDQGDPEDVVPHVGKGMPSL